MRAAGGNHRLFRSWVDGVWKIPTDHFDPRLRPQDGRLRSFALEEVLVENSTYGRANVKHRVLAGRSQAAGLRASGPNGRA